MTTHARRDAVLPTLGARPADVAAAVNQLERRPKVPLKTPVSGDDGYDGEICRDSTRLYVYTNGAWRYVALSAL